MPKRLDYFLSVLLFTGCLTSAYVGTARARAYCFADDDEFEVNLQPSASIDCIVSDYEDNVATSSAYEAGPDASQTSLFMIGKISVSIIFVESNGSIDVETEDWSQLRIDWVVDNIVAGLSWLSSQEPRGRIEWVFHTHVVETSYEPITREEEYLWVNEAMSSLGYDFTETHSWRLRSFVDDLRRADESHWAFAIFVVDSLNDIDGKFPNGHAAYAHGFGPYFVTTYDAGPWRNLGRFDLVVAHEAAHVFGAADEYSPCNPEREYGFLRVQNLNCSSGCLMDSTDRCLSLSTRYQLGWRDEDNDCILDAMDTDYNSWADTDGDGTVDYLDLHPQVPNPRILSPVNTTYPVNIVPLIISISALKPSEWISYNLDNQNNNTILSNTTLVDLSDGTHTITIYANTVLGTALTRVFFSVDTMPPTLRLISPPNGTVTTRDIPLTFTVDEPLSWVSYNLDHSSNRTTPLINSSIWVLEGEHILYLYANDTVGNMAYAIAQFTVAIIHDIALLNITSSKDHYADIPAIGHGQTIDVSITVENQQAWYQETMNVTLYVDFNPVAELQVPLLLPLRQTTLSLTWNTTDYALGNYTLSASVSLAHTIEEAEVTDNEVIYGVVLVTLTGDADADRDVDIYDIVKITAHLNSNRQLPNYHPNNDVNNDAYIDINDALLAASHYGEDW